MIDEDVVSLSDDDIEITYISKTKRKRAIKNSDVFETIDLDEVSTANQNTLSNNNNTNKKRRKNALPSSLNGLYAENPMLADFIEQCLDLENSEGMSRIINNTLIRLYTEMDSDFKHSSAFQRHLSRASRSIETDPFHKYSHLKTLCEVMKNQKAKKRVALVTLATGLKKNGAKRPGMELHSHSKKQKINNVIDLVDESDVSIVDIEETPNDVIILDESQSDGEKENHKKLSDDSKSSGSQVETRVLNGIGTQERSKPNKSSEPRIEVRWDSNKGGEPTKLSEPQIEVSWDPDAKDINENSKLTKPSDPEIEVSWDRNWKAVSENSNLTKSSKRQIGLSLDGNKKVNNDTIKPTKSSQQEIEISWDKNTKDVHENSNLTKSSKQQIEVSWDQNRKHKHKTHKNETSQPTKSSDPEIEVSWDKNTKDVHENSNLTKSSKQQIEVSWDQNRKHKHKTHKNEISQPTKSSDSEIEISWDKNAKDVHKNSNLTKSSKQQIEVSWDQNRKHKHKTHKNETSQPTKSSDPEIEVSWDKNTKDVHKNSNLIKPSKQQIEVSWDQNRKHKFKTHKNETSQPTKSSDPQSEVNWVKNTKNEHQNSNLTKTSKKQIEVSWDPKKKDNNKTSEPTKSSETQIEISWDTNTEDINENSEPNKLLEPVIEVNWEAHTEIDLNDTETDLNDTEIFSSPQSTLEDDELKAKIMNLENEIDRCNKHIKILDEAEVDLDSTVSPYIMSEKYKERVVQLYEEICRLTGHVPTKRRKVRLEVREGHPDGPVRKLEQFLNDNIGADGKPPFPDLTDVIKCVIDANVEYNLNWKRHEVLNEARSLFLHCGKALQQQRQRREYKDLLSLMTEATDDPAEKDPELQARLQSNRLVAQKKEKHIIERYATMQDLPPKKVQPCPANNHESESMSIQPDLPNHSNQSSNQKFTEEKGIPDHCISAIVFSHNAKPKKTDTLKNHSLEVIKNVNTINERNKGGSDVELIEHNKNHNLEIEEQVKPEVFNENTQLNGIETDEREFTKKETADSEIDEDECDGQIKEEFEIDIHHEPLRIENTDDYGTVIKTEIVDCIVKKLEDLGDDYTVSVLDIEDPFVCIEISDSSDDEC